MTDLSTQPGSAMPDPASGVAAPATSGTPGGPVPTAGRDAQPSDRGRTPAEPTTGRKRGAERTRAGSFWVFVVATAVLLLVLIDFIAQNGQRASVHFLGWDGHVSQAVALLFAAVVAALIVAVPAAVRIVQLRHALRKQGRR